MTLTIQTLGRDRFDEAVALCEDTFEAVYPRNEIRRSFGCVDPDLSVGLFRGGVMVGTYLISTVTVDRCIHLRLHPEFRCLFRRTALRGDAIALRPDERGRGTGRLLRAILPEIARTNRIDYVWGSALHELNNLDDWLRRRVLFAQTPGGNHTVEPVAADLKWKLMPFASPECLARWALQMNSPRQIQGEIVYQAGPIPRLWCLSDTEAYPIHAGRNIEQILIEEAGQTARFTCQVEDGTFKVQGKVQLLGFAKSANNVGDDASSVAMAI